MPKLVAAAQFARLAQLGRVPRVEASTVDPMRAFATAHQRELLIVGVGLLIASVLGVRLWLRNRVRVCERCANPRQLLEECEEDRHLDQGQMTEERVGSVDYDVWWCAQCQDALVIAHGALFTTKSKCPRCAARTVSTTTTTMRRATEDEEGLERIVEQCANCTYSNQESRLTPRRRR